MQAFEKWPLNGVIKNRLCFLKSAVTCGEGEKYPFRGNVCRLI
jgi:hypothetical protein